MKIGRAPHAGIGLIAIMVCAPLVECAVDSNSSRAYSLSSRQDTTSLSATGSVPSSDAALRSARAAFAMPTCEALAPDEQADVLETQDVEYAVLDGESLTLDLARPAGRGPFPAVLLLHGGGFCDGDKRDMRRLMLSLAARGYAAVSVGYRLIRLGHHRFPAGMADVRCAARFLAAHAESLRIDPGRMGALGFSAGGHLATSLTWQAETPGLDGGCPYPAPVRLAGAVAYFPPLDFRGAVSFGVPLRALLWAVFNDGEHSFDEMARLASPIAFAKRADPPVLVIHGTEDRVIPIALSRTALLEARRAGATMDLLEARGLGHGFGLSSARAPRPTTCAALRFLEEAVGAGPHMAYSSAHSPDG